MDTRWSRRQYRHGIFGSMKMEGGRTDITILGDVVNTTARLCSQAPTEADALILGHPYTQPICFLQTNLKSEYIIQENINEFRRRT